MLVRTTGVTCTGRLNLSASGGALAPAARAPAGQPRALLQRSLRQLQRQQQTHSHLAQGMPEMVVTMPQEHVATERASPAAEAKDHLPRSEAGESAADGEGPPQDGGHETGREAALHCRVRLKGYGFSVTGG